MYQLLIGRDVIQGYWVTTLTHLERCRIYLIVVIQFVRCKSELKMVRMETNYFVRGRIG